MINNDFGVEIKYPIDVIPINKFAELMGKTPNTVKKMISEQKLPVVNLINADKPNAKVGERWIYLPEFNRIVREAYFDSPAKERDAWTRWFKKESQ